MQAASLDSGGEPSSMLWGLDPVFSASARLFVKDILQMRESCQVPGIYFYNSHPIFKVDVLGIVVYKREREDFFCYGVDDGTGVINCLCWKSEQWRDQGGSGKSSAKSSGAGSTSGVFNPVAELRKLCEAEHRACQLEIGELLRVRGHVKTSRQQQREIMASTYYKVNDPVMALQIAWMMDGLQLYKRFYDEPFLFDSSCTQGPSAPGDPAAQLLHRATQTLKEYLRAQAVPRFRPYDVEDLLQPLVTNPPQKTSHQAKESAAAMSDTAGASGAAGVSAAARLHQLLQESLQTLEEEGVVFRKVKSEDQVYHVTEQDKDLRMAARDIIAEDSKREKYADKGVHVLHILSGLRQRYSRNLGRAALELVLTSLETHSDIISTSDCYYTVF